MVIRKSFEVLQKAKIPIPDIEFIPKFEVFAKYMQRAYLQFKIHELESEGIVVPAPIVPKQD